MKAKQKTVIVAIAIVVIVFICLLISGKGIIPKATIKDTKVYGLKINKKQAIYNVTGSVDYYIKMQEAKGEQKRWFYGIYSFDVKAGVDFTENEIQETSDSLLFPVPIVKADQNDIESPCILDQVGEIDWNNELQPVKTAMEMMAKDFGLRTLISESERALKEYFEKIDTSHHYGFYETGNYKRDTSCFKYFPLIVDTYPDVLNHNIKWDCEDRYFTRQGIRFYDYSDSKKQIFTISYVKPAIASFDENTHDLEQSFDYYVRLIDPFAPKEKLIFIGKDKISLIVGGKEYVGRWSPDIVKEEYYADIIYLVSCLRPSRTSQMSLTHEEWIESYDNLIEKINVGHFQEASRLLREMGKIQMESGPDISLDEEYLTSLVCLLGDLPIALTKNDEQFNSILAGYYDINKGDANQLKSESSYRDSLISCIRKHNLSFANDLITAMEVYLISNYYNGVGNVVGEDLSTIKKDLLERGVELDPAVVRKLDGEYYLRYRRNQLYSAIRQKDKRSYEDKELSDNFPTPDGQNNVPKEVLFVHDNNSLGSIDYSKAKKLLFDQNKISSKDYSFVYLYKVNRKKQNKGDNDAFLRDKHKKVNRKKQNKSDNDAFLRDKHKKVNLKKQNKGDNDAVIFLRDTLIYIPNYDRKRHSIYSVGYNELSVEKDYIKMSENLKEKYFIRDEYVREMCRRINNGYNKDSDGKPEQYYANMNEIMKRFIIEYINDKCTPIDNREKLVTLER